jgi:hypothetical protein
MTWVQLVAGKEQNLHRDVEGIRYGKRHMNSPRVDGRTKLKWVFKKYTVKLWTKFVWLKIGTQWQTIVPKAMNLLIS